MKKIIAIAAASLLAALTQAAQVGWSAGIGDAAYNGDAYKLFVIGQKGVTDIAQITALLDAGTDTSSYAFGSGTIANARVANPASASSPSLGAGTYESFMVIFDSAPADVKSGETKYVVLSGVSTQTITITAQAATAMFAAGNVSNVLGNSSNWHDYGAVPEPTSVALLALGLAALGLKRKVA